MSEHHPAPSQTLLLDIYQRLATVEAQLKQLLEQAGHAANDRKEILSLLVEVETMRDTIRHMVPIVQELERLRQRGLGAGLLGGYLVKVLWALIGAGIALFGTLMHWWTR